MDRCGCGFVMPGPMHGRVCDRYGAYVDRLLRHSARDALLAATRSLVQANVDLATAPPCTDTTALVERRDRADADFLRAVARVCS